MEEEKIFKYICTPPIQIFRPTKEELKNFSKYIQHIESQGAHHAGLAKIIPPEGWCPRKGGYGNIDDLLIPEPVNQTIVGRYGFYQQYATSDVEMTVKEFKTLAESPEYRTPDHFSYVDLERKFWGSLDGIERSAKYGADVPGSLFDDDVEEFNIQRLNTILDILFDDNERKIEGINTAYLYFGMWKSTFAWHTEDLDLYSINYLHFGAPKQWYVIPPRYGRIFENKARISFRVCNTRCPSFLRHKHTIIAPHILSYLSVPLSKITQEPGEFIITFPYAYHVGFNHGYNVAEATNFALPRWVEYGKRASKCTCGNTTVDFSMEKFIKKFQSDRYELWNKGEDYGYHPEDPERYYAAPAPKKQEKKGKGKSSKTQKSN